MRYTHSFDFVHRLLLFVGAVVLVLMCVNFVEPGWNALSAWNPFEGFDLVLALTATAGCVAGLYLGAGVLRRTLLPGWPFTWAYALTSARVRLSADEAERLTPLVDGSGTGTWMNLSKIRTLSHRERKQGLLFIANRFAEENGVAVPFPAIDEMFRRAARQEEEAQRRAQGDQSESSGKGSGSSRNEGQERSSPGEIAQALLVLSFTDGRPDFEAVRQAYRKKIADYHPDRFEGKDEALRRFVEDQAKKINAAYRVLERAYGAKS